MQVSLYKFFEFFSLLGVRCAVEGKSGKPFSFQAISPKFDKTRFRGQCFFFSMKINRDNRYSYFTQGYFASFLVHGVQQDFYNLGNVVWHSEGQ